MNCLSKNIKPQISIGMPVCNGEKFIRPVIESLLNQSFENFELIISDNASTDKTKEICKYYAANDIRVKYFRQSENIGAIQNFKYVFMAASAEYFMWAACDDIRSLDYLELNYQFLSNNHDYVASSCPNGFENWNSDKKLIDFSLEENQAHERYLKFFHNCFQSHGLFYSLLRTQILRNNKLLDEVFTQIDWLGFDWAIILCLASEGKINRTVKGKIVFGVCGVSNKLNIFTIYNNSFVEYFIPFYKLSGFVIKLTCDLSVWQRVRFLFVLLKLNVYAVVSPVYRNQINNIYMVYCKYIKSKVKSLKSQNI